MSSGWLGTRGNGSYKAYLQDGYTWSHVSLYANGHGGWCRASASVVLKDGTSIPLYTQTGMSGSTPTVYLANVLSAAQMAQIDYIQLNASASGAAGSCQSYPYESNGSAHYCNGASASAYALSIPWINE